MAPRPRVIGAALRVRAARMDDADAVEALLDAAAAWQRELGYPQWRAGRFGDEVRDGIAEAFLYVGHRAGEVVGCFMLDGEHPAWMRRWLADQGHDPDGAHLARLAVAREHAGGGLGADLVDAASGLAVDHGLPFLRLDCPDENLGLLRYYRRIGFTHLGDVPTPGPAGEPWVSSVFQRPTDEDSGRDGGRE